MRRFALALGALSLFGSATPAHALTDPAEVATRITDFFVELSEKWKRIVKDEERAQFVRALDRLRRSIYALEGDTNLLANSLPVEIKDASKRVAVRENAARLRSAVEEMKRDAREIGADLRRFGADDTDILIDHAGQTRAGNLDFLEENLQNPDSWNSAVVKKRLLSGVIALRNAQISVTNFRNKFADEI